MVIESSSTSSSSPPAHQINENREQVNVIKNYDGSAKLDTTPEQNPIYTSQYLSTHPLRSEIAERPGPGGLRLTYLTGDSAIRNMNLVFGYDGWGTEIRETTQIQSDFEKEGNRWVVSYSATVRASIKGGMSHDDIGFGEGIHRNKRDAHEKAMKCSVTDAMKRCVRHFGERLGNALYKKKHDINVRNAPVDNKATLELLQDRERKLWCDDDNDVKRRRVGESKHNPQAVSPQDAGRGFASTNNGVTGNNNPTYNNAHTVSPPENRVFPSGNGNNNNVQETATRLNFNNSNTPNNPTNHHHHTLPTLPASNSIFLSALSLEKIPTVPKNTYHNHSTTQSLTNNHAQTPSNPYYPEQNNTNNIPLSSQTHYPLNKAIVTTNNLNVTTTNNINNNNLNQQHPNVISNYAQQFDHNINSSYVMQQQQQRNHSTVARNPYANSSNHS